MKQYDWLQNEFFISWGLHHGQDFSGGELQHGWKIDMIANMTTLFGRGDSFGSQVSWANSKPQTRNLAFGELRL
jgi:hypothetical protein